MKIRKILCSLAIASVATTAIAPIASCGCTKNEKYSELVKTVVNKLVDMDKYPRCTSNGDRQNLDAIRVWIIKEAVQSGAAYGDIHTDEYGNVWFDVNASSGYENYKPLILQGHMDMVVAGLPDETKTTTPIDVEVDWDKGIVHSKDYKTSLGADDGAGLAIILTLLQDPTFKHGPLRIIFTADEDSGMGGAGFIYNQNPYILQWTGPLTEGEEIEYLLNIDAEGIGEVYRSCFGSKTYNYYDYALDASEEEKLTNNYALEVKGLKGGHSGDIGQKMASAEKCIYEILNSLNQTNAIQLVKHYHPDPSDPTTDISFQRNQIVPHAKLLFNSSLDKAKITEVINTKINSWKNIYTAEDWTNVQITITDSTETSEHSKYLSKEDSDKIIKVLGTNNDSTSMQEDGGLWYGAVVNDGKTIKSANISPVEIEYNKDTGMFGARIVCQFRTSTNSLLDDMTTYYNSVKPFKTDVNVTGYYPAWEYNASKENKIIEMATKAFEAQSIEPKIVDSNGGMENSYWAYANPDLHCTGIGPTITGAHSTQETLYIDTIEPIINVVKYICEQMKK